MSSYFPLSASVGQIYNGYTFDGERWNLIPSEYNPATFSSQPPSNPSPGDLWVDSDSDVDILNDTNIVNQSDLDDYLTTLSASTTYATKTELSNYLTSGIVFEKQSGSSINQGSSQVIMSNMTIPAGKYIMNLSTLSSYSNGNTSMTIPQLTMILSTESTYVNALTNPSSNYWPTTNSAEPYRMNFDVQSANGDPIQRRPISATSFLDLSESKVLNLICRHYSNVIDDNNESITLFWSRITLVKIDNLAINSL